MPWDAQDAEEEEEAEAEQAFGPASKEAVVFLVDAGARMLEGGGGGEEPPRQPALATAVACVAAELRHRVVCSEDDSVGVVLFGTKEQKGPMGFAGVYVLQDLDLPDAARIIELEGLDADAISARVGSCAGAEERETALERGLWTAQSLLQAGAGGSGRAAVDARVLLFTNDDCPLAPGSDGAAVVSRAKEMAESHRFRVEVYGMPPPGGGARFDFDRLFARVHTDFDPRAAQTAPEFLRELKEMVRRRVAKRRRLRAVELSVGEGAALRVGMYAPYAAAKPGAAIVVDARDHSVLKREVAYCCDDTAEVINPRLKSCEYARGKVVFTRDELAQVKTLGEEGLRVLGFKPTGALAPHHQLKPSSFLYPDEDEAVPAFTALHRQMLRAGRIALARFVPRRGVLPRLVALVPQAEQADASGQTVPPGLALVWLPYADDMRQPEAVVFPQDAEAARADAEQTEAATRVVRTMFLGEEFSCASIDNPHLQKHYAAVEMEALQREAPRVTADLTLPDVEGFKAHGGAEAVKAFKDAVYGENHDAEAAAEAAAKDAKAAGRKRKAEGGPAAPVDWENLDANMCGVTELKEYCKSHNLKVTGKKDELVERCRKHARGEA